MEKRPKNMPRWEWKKSLEKEKKDMLQKNPQKNQSNILGTIIATIVMLGIVWMIFASFSGEPEYIQDPYDGSNRSIYP